MSLECNGVGILSQGEWTALCDDMAPGEGSPTLSAWALGALIPSQQLLAAFDVDARLAARTSRADRIIDLATGRLEHAFPGVALR